MSRSYKRYPVHVKKKRQQLKRYIIAKSVASDIANGGQHKRVTQRYDIYDWRFRPAGHVNEMDWDIKNCIQKKIMEYNHDRERRA